MNADLLAELAHLFFVDAQDWEGNLRHGQRERDYLYKCSRALAERAVKEDKRERRPADNV